MSDLGDRLLPFKIRAQRHKKAATQALTNNEVERAREEFDEARYAIEDAFAEIERISPGGLQAVGPIDRAAKDHAAELADCWGILGGIFRAERRTEEAIDAYEEGYKYESKPEYENTSTYNTVNRLAVRLLDDPGLLRPGAPQPADARLNKPIRELLAEAGEAVEAKWRLMDDPVWALADMVLIKTLLHAQDADEWETLLVTKATDRFPFDSLATMARTLSRAALPMSADLTKLAERLQRTADERFVTPQPATSG